jgi:hypothetical protein
MFIPKRLEVTEKPEMSNFPVNVLFVSFRIADGRLQAGSALYEPDFDTYHREENQTSMKYHNVYGGGYLVVTFDEIDRRYRGEKSVNRKPVGLSIGGDWQSFFMHFTLLGLPDGERCKFDYVEDLQDSSTEALENSQHSCNEY